MHVKEEAIGEKAAFGERAELRYDVSVDDLNRLLEGRRVWMHSGHGDVPLDGEPTLAFEKEGRTQAVRIETIATTVRSHKGTLKLVVLMGCKTRQLAEELKETGIFSNSRWRRPEQAPRWVRCRTPWRKYSEGTGPHRPPCQESICKRARKLRWSRSV